MDDNELGAEQEKNAVRMRVESKIPEMSGQVLGLSEELNKNEVMVATLKKYKKFLGQLYGSGVNVEDLSFELKKGDKTGVGQVVKEDDDQRVEVEMILFGSPEAEKEKNNWIEHGLLKEIPQEQIEEKYRELAYALTVSTAGHEGTHVLIDSRPGSKLETDFLANTGIVKNEGGHTLSFFDEGLAYAFQALYTGKVEGIKVDLSPNPREGEKSYCVNARKELGLALRDKVKEYMDGNLQIDEAFLKFAGELMKNKDIVDIEKYVAEAESERVQRIFSKAAEKVLSEPVPLITDKSPEIVPPNANEHDYVSMAPYWYEGENKPRDGEINPEVNKYSDPKKLESAVNGILITSLVVEHEGDLEKKKKYAEYAKESLDVWFVNEETRMTPSLEYAQMKPGEETGNFYGIIEGIPLVRVTEGVNKLKKAGFFDENNENDRKTLEGVNKWFTEYLDWLQLSKKAVGDIEAQNDKEKGGEKGMTNNHGTFYDVQVAYIADFLGESEIASMTLEGVKERINNQILPTGEMPEETARKTETIDVSMDYQIFNLYAFSELATLGEKYGIDLWGHQKTEGEGGLHKAFEYFTGLLEKQEDKTKTFHFDRTGPLYLAFRAASKAYKNDGYWNLPKDYYANPLVDEVSREMFK